ncbi:hypothetical protein AMECASPLE_015106 [Ameca splendens]|uniref:Uncharacterized protein n=1 Tax=Ameca splendens TaxID=208324 RepID=A0ABV0XEY2_9TELE
MRITQKQSTEEPPKWIISHRDNREQDKSTSTQALAPNAFRLGEDAGLLSCSKNVLVLILVVFCFIWNQVARAADSVETLRHLLQFLWGETKEF